MKKVLFLSIIALTSCLYSCQSKSSRSTDTTTDSITVKEVTIKETYHLSGDTAKPACRIAFAIDVPVKYQQESDGIQLQKILTPLIFGDEYAPDSLFESSAQKAVASHIAAYKELEPEFEKELKENEASYSFEWEFDYTLSTVYNHDNLLCYGLSTSEYTGGAHGMYADFYYTIDLSNWHRVVLDDIFRPKSLDQVNRVLLDQLLKSLNLSTPDSLLELGFFDTENITANENFYLTNKGICWVFNPYEIACYATGQVRIEVPFKEIEMYMLPESPVRRLIK